MALRNRYPHADILAQREHWDDATREVVLDRVHNVPAFEHFGEHERATLEALCDRVIPQGHKPADRQRADRALDRPAVRHDLARGLPVRQHAVE